VPLSLAHDDSESLPANEADQEAPRRLSELVVRRDIDVVLWSMNLHKVRRFFHQRFWESETRDAEYASRLESYPRLESVAEHCWHVADIVLLLGRHFTMLDRNQCLRLAILHDKMEMLTGDQTPVGRDGTGDSTHAFNPSKRVAKDLTEREAISEYVSRLPPDARSEQRDLLVEALSGTTNESRFVKAIDKLQAFCFVLLKKRGSLEDKHLEFTLQYSLKAPMYWTGLGQHYSEIRSRFLTQVARRRGTSVKLIEAQLSQFQLDLPFLEPLD